MKIKIENVEIKDEWDYQKGKLLLEMQGVSGAILTPEQSGYLDKEITKFLWREVQKQFPRITEFLTNKKGGFNSIDGTRNFNTPIIGIFGHFYMQLIGQSNSRNWIWQSVDLEPYRFYFNQEGYLRSQITDAMNKLILTPYSGSKKKDFTKLIKALNDKPVKVSEIGIDGQGGVHMLERNTIVT